MEFLEKKAEVLFGQQFMSEVQKDAHWVDTVLETQKLHSTVTKSICKVKYLFVILLDDILPKQSHSEKYGDDRHPLVQYFHKFAQRDLDDESIASVTNLVLAFDFSTTLVEHQLHLINGNLVIIIL